MEISPDKTKVMTNNPNGFQREIKITSQRLEEVENFKYLGAVISNEESKPEILSRIAQTTAALSRLKIGGTRTSRLLLRLSWCGRSSYLPSFMPVRAGPWQRRIQALEMRCCRRLLNISYQDHVTKQGGSQLNPECNWSAWWSPNHGKETETQMVWSHLKILWHGEDNSARDSERSKKERKTEEEMGR